MQFENRPSIYLSGNTYSLYQDPEFKKILYNPDNPITMLKNALGEWQYVCPDEKIAKIVLEFIRGRGYEEASASFVKTHKDYSEELSCIILHNITDSALYKLGKNSPQWMFSKNLVSTLSKVFADKEQTASFFKELNTCPKNYGLLNLYSVISTAIVNKIPGISELRPKDAWEKSGFIVDDIAAKKCGIPVLGPTFSVENVTFDPENPEENRKKISKNEKYMSQIITGITNFYVKMDYNNTLFGFDPSNYKNSIGNIERFEQHLNSSGFRDKVLSYFSDEEKRLYNTLINLKNEISGSVLFDARVREYEKVFYPAVRRYVDFTLNTSHSVLTLCNATVTKHGTTSCIYNEIPLQGVKLPTFETEELKKFAYDAYDILRSTFDEVFKSKDRDGESTLLQTLKNSQALALRYASDISVYKKKGLPVSRDLNKLRYDDTSFIKMCSRNGVRTHVILPKILSAYFKHYPTAQEKFEIEKGLLEKKIHDNSKERGAAIENLRNVFFREGLSRLFFRPSNSVIKHLEPNAIQKVAAEKAYNKLVARLSPQIVPSFSMVPNKVFAEKLVSNLPFDKNHRVIENDSETSHEYLFRAFKTFVTYSVHTYDNGFERNPSDFDDYARALLGKKYFNEYEHNPLVSSNLRSLETDLRALHLTHFLSLFPQKNDCELYARLIDAATTYPSELFAHLFVKTSSDSIQRELMSVVKHAYNELGKDFDSEKEYLTKVKSNNILYTQEVSRAIGLKVEEPALIKELDTFINKTDLFKKASDTEYYLIPADRYSQSDAREIIPLLSFLNDSGIIFTTKNPQLKDMVKTMEQDLLKTIPLMENRPKMNPKAAYSEIEK